MKVWAISDLHLSAAKPKPMDVFGKHWKNHPEKIARSWKERVSSEDLVLCPGDISWAMTLEEALPDLQFIDALPGKKILLRGNHDYWWKRKSIGQVRKKLPSSILLLQKNALAFLPDLLIFGTRGWRFPGEFTQGDQTHPTLASSEKSSEEQDQKILAREIEFLKQSLKEAKKIGLAGKTVLGMMHYPPFRSSREVSPFDTLFQEAGTKICIYGHLHGEDTRHAFQGLRNGIEYRLVSADAIDFQPIRLL